MVTVANRMPLIEGVGDEVIFFAGLMVLIICIVLAWFSTSVSEQPLIRTAVLVIERRHAHIANTNQTEELENRSQTSLADNQSSGRKSAEILKSSSSSSCSGSSQRTETSDGAPSTSNKDADAKDLNKVDECILENASIICDVPVQEQKQDSLESEIQKVCKETETIEADGVRHRNVNADSKTEDVSTEDNLVRKIEAASVASALDDKNTENSGIISQQWVEIARTETIPEASNLSEIAGVIRIRLKFLNDSQRLVEGNLEEPLGDFKRRYFREELENDKTVRLIFNGQLLRSDQETLQFYGLFDNCVVHCQISNTVAAPAAMQIENYSELDVSRFMLPLFGVILGVIWYCRIQYRQFFNATSTFALLGITGLFFVSLIALFIPRREHRQPPLFN